MKNLWNKSTSLLYLSLLSPTSFIFAQTMDKEVSYALGASLSEQIAENTDITDTDAFYDGFYDNIENKDLKLNTKELDYASGVQYSGYIQKQNFDVDSESFLEGFEASLKQQPMKMTAEERQDKIQSYFNNLKEKREEEMNELAEINKKEGEDFLKENALKEGVVTLESGLQYKVSQKASTKKHPKFNDTVEVHYVGRFIDGQEFDSSVRRGESTKFKVGQVIPGWVEILQVMSPGDKWEVFIPSDLAYGQTAHPAIGPNKTLIFDIELLDVLTEDTVEN